MQFEWAYAYQRGPREDERAAQSTIRVRIYTFQQNRQKNYLLVVEAWNRREAVDDARFYLTACFRRYVESESRLIFLHQAGTYGRTSNDLSGRKYYETVSPLYLYYTILIL